jgi:hypothetical protein
MPRKKGLEEVEIQNLHTTTPEYLTDDELLLRTFCTEDLDRKHSGGWDNDHPKCRFCGKGYRFRTFVTQCNKQASHVNLSIQFDTNVSQLLSRVLSWCCDPLSYLGELSWSRLNRLSVCLSCLFWKIYSPFFPKKMDSRHKKIKKKQFSSALTSSWRQLQYQSFWCQVYVFSRYRLLCGKVGLDFVQCFRK